MGDALRLADIESFGVVVAVRDQVGGFNDQIFILPCPNAAVLTTPILTFASTRMCKRRQWRETFVYVIWSIPCAIDCAGKIFFFVTVVVPFLLFCGIPESINRWVQITCI